MKTLIKTTRGISKDELDEVREIFPDIQFTIDRTDDKPVPTWNPYFRLIEIDWDWFRSLFKNTDHDTHAYVTDEASLEAVGVERYIGLYSLDKDQTHEFWFGVPSRLSDIAKRNGFRTNFARLFVHEILHGKEHFAGRKDRVHEMERQGRLKELAQEYTTANHRIELMEQIIPLATQVIELLRIVLGRRYQRPLPDHWTNISQPYMNYDPQTYTQSGVHPGVDFPAPLNTPILAPADGEITRSSYSSDLGYWVEFKFGDLYLVPLHLANAQKPRSVKRGEPIGFVGRTGLIRGIHGHLEGWKRPMDRSLLTSPAKVQEHTFDITELIR